MRRVYLLTILAAVPVACGDPSAPRVWDPIEIAAPAIEADTVDAIVSQPIRVTIRTPDGRPVIDLPVLFVAANGFVAGDAAGLGGMQSWESETDTDGRAAVWFRLGSSADEAARLEVHAGVDEAVLEMNVLPGAAAGLRAIPAETALALTHSYTLEVQTVDRHDNPRPGTVDATVTSRRPDIAEVSGSDITVLVPGRAILDLAAGGLTGTAIAYGMPPGRLALAGREVIDVFDMGDDSLVHVADAGSPCASWHPDGEQVLLQNLVIASTTGAVARIPTGTDSIIGGCGEFSVDGSWIYFDGRRETDWPDASHIWRIRADGSQLEQITAGYRASHPSPSPDGTRVTFMQWGVVQGVSADFVVVATIGSAALDTIAPPVASCTVHNCDRGITSVRWSPTGEWIAYTTRTSALAGGGPFVSLHRYGSLVRLVRPDGSETRYIGPPGSEPHHHGFWGGVSWSPDGEWLAGVSFPDSRIRLVELASAEEVMLNTAVGGQPAWADH